jgi:hypothetical protein
MDEHQAHRFLTDLYSRHIPQEEPKRNTTCATHKTT